MVHEKTMGVYKKSMSQGYLNNENFELKIHIIPLKNLSFFL